MLEWKNMRIVHRWKGVLDRSRVSRRFRLSLNRPFCSSGSNKKPTAINNSSGKNGSSSSPSFSTYDEQYKALKNLDFMTAAKMIFSDAPKRKKFGFDFHLVQFFIVCLPSLAVYLVAQYARSEMRRMDAELEKKKQAEFEAHAKEMELKAAKEKEQIESNPLLLEVRERLDKLEERVKEIDVESKMQQSKSITVAQEVADEKRRVAQVEPENIQNDSSMKTPKETGTHSTEGKTRGSESVTHTSQSNKKDNQK